MPWACEICTFANADSKAKCEMCAAAKPAKAASDAKAKPEPVAVAAPAVAPAKSAAALDSPAASTNADWDDEGWDDGPKAKPTADATADGDDEGWDDDPKPKKPAAAPAATPAAASTPVKAGGASAKDSKQSPTMAAVKDSAGELSGAAKPKLYSVLTRAQVLSRQQRTAEDVCEVLGVSSDEAVVLLREYKWKVQPLQDAWFADARKVRDKIGVHERKAKTAAPAATTAPATAVDGKTVAAPAAAPVTFDCGLCMDTAVESEYSALPCGHAFCENCWANWCLALYGKGPNALLIGRCAGDKCKERITSGWFRRYLPAGPKRSAIDDWILTSFVQANDATLKWCPRAKCERAIEYRLFASGESCPARVECDCAHAWCFKCTADDHSPAPCDLITRWQAKCKSDSSNVQWILANTKICPKCRSPIEKNQGCDHMTCRSCHHEFCWLCKADWNNHNACNQFDPAEKSSAESAGKALERFQHYFSRYDNHFRAIQYAENTRAECERKMEVLQKLSGAGALGVAFLLHAANTLIDCRRLLQWSYCLAFFMADSNDVKALFELHQKALEQFTGELSAMTEQVDIEELVTPANRTAVINLTRVLHKYLENIVKFGAENEAKYKFRKDL